MTRNDTLAAPEKSDEDVSGNQVVSRSAFKLMLGGLLNLIAGLGSQVAIAALFGASAEMDAFLTALAIPIYFRAVLLSGVSFVFIPAFIKYQTEGRKEDAWNLFGTFFWLTAGILTIAAVAVSVLAPRTISLSAPGLSPAKAQLAANMLAIVIFAVPLTGVGTLATGVQNARNIFFWPKARWAVGSLGNLLILLLFYRTIGPMALAWGYLLSAALAASVTTVPVLRHGWSSALPLGDVRVRKLARLIAPFVILGLLMRARPLVERYFASSLPDGELSYLGYAARISRILNALLATTIVTAIFPVMSRSYAQDGLLGLRKTSKYGMRLTLAVGLPLVAITSAVAVPFVTVLYERGAFLHATTLQVSRIVPIVVVGVVLIPMIGSLIARAFYVTEDTRTPPITAIIVAVSYIVLAYFLVKPWGYVGLASANMLSAGLGTGILGLVLVYRWHVFHPKKIFRYVVAYGLPSLAAFVVARLLLHAMAFLPELLQLGIAGLVSAVLYMVILRRIDSTIADDILEMIGIQRVLKIAAVQRGRNIVRESFGQLTKKVPR